MVCNNILTRWKLLCRSLVIDAEQARRLEEEANEAELPLTSIGPGEIGGPYQREIWQ